MTAARWATESDPASCRGWPLHRGRGDDLRHDLAQIVVGLVDHDLARGAVAPLEQILHRLELTQRTQVLAMLAHPVDQPAGQLARRHPVPSGQVDELAVESVP